MANQILPDVVKKYTKIIFHKNKIIQMEKQIQISVSTLNSFKEYVCLKQKLNSSITEFYKAVEELEDIGVMIKSIDDGLLDFPAKRFNEDVWLCWKYGETEIKFWHDKNSGFEGRKPIQVSDETLV